LLFKKGILSRHDVYTLRKGEVVRHVDDTLKELEEEIVKIKGQGGGWTCMFFDNDKTRCAIYQDRPLECRVLQCWDHHALQRAMEKPYLQRRDLLGIHDGLLKLITSHDQRCGYDTLKAAVRQVEGSDPDKGVERVLDLLQYDDFMRPFLIEKLRISPDTMDFLFGRPLTETIRRFGLQVKMDGETRMLVPLERKTPSG